MTRRSICEALEAGEVIGVQLTNGDSYDNIIAVEPMPDAVYVTVLASGVPESYAIRGDHEETVLQFRYDQIENIAIVKEVVEVHG